MNNATTTANIFSEAIALEAICNELGLTNVKYLTSPKGGNDEAELANHAISMLEIYKRYKNGDTTAPIKEIIFN